jgi:transposase-like protein
MTNIITITSLISENRCYEEIRNLRWPLGVVCPHCPSEHVIKKGHHTNQMARQRYQCKACLKRFDDLTGTVLAGHHQPITVWVLCLYFMGLNLSNSQIAEELDLNLSDTHHMCSTLRSMVDEKKVPQHCKTKLNLTKPMLWLDIKGNQQK